MIPPALPRPDPDRPPDSGGRTERRPLGRRPGAGDTRSSILAAARSEFAAHGYDGVTVRGIARSAGVDAALVHHYFGSKEQVFVAAMALPFPPGEVIPALLADHSEGIGARVAAAFLEVWARPDSRDPVLAMIRSATTNERAAAMLREFLTATVLPRAAEALDRPDARLRVELAMGALVGMALLRFVVRAEPLASASDEELIAMLAPVIDACLARAD